jgi:hypothetical protein
MQTLRDQTRDTGAHGVRSKSPIDCSKSSSSLARRLLRIDSPNDAIAGRSCRSANDEGLDSAEEDGFGRANHEPVLDSSEEDEDDAGDSDGCKEGVLDIFHDEVRDHGDDTSWGCQRQHSGGGVEHTDEVGETHQSCG